MESSAKTRHFNDLLSTTKALVSPIELQTQKLIAQGQDIMKRKSAGNIADALKEDTSESIAFRKEVDALMKKYGQVTSQTRKTVQTRKAIAVRSQMMKKRAGLNYRSEEEAISLYDAFQTCLIRLVRIPNDVCLEILGSTRCRLDVGATPPPSSPPSTIEPTTTEPIPTTTDLTTTFVSNYIQSVAEEEEDSFES